MRNPSELIRFFVLQRVKGFEVPAEPHLDAVAAPRFADLLNECATYLEFGSGGSTVLADKVGKKTLTVESDRFFAKAVRQSLGPQSRVTIIDVDIGMTGPWSYPILGRPTPRRLRHWSRYIYRPFELLSSERWFPDFVFVDGRFRRACVLQTARKALHEGRSLKLLFDDYFADDRQHYHVIERWLGTPERVGRAALFTVDAQHCRMPSEHDVADAIRDYR